MAIASLTSWLNNPDKNYTTGRLLYEQYGTNPVLTALFKSGQGSYHFSKLQTALEELNLQTDLVPKPIVISEYVKEPAIVLSNGVDFKSAPQQIIDIRDEKTKRYAQARKLHESIRIMDSKEHRLAAAIELLAHMKYVNECWASIDLYKETGEVKPLPQEEQATDVQQLTFKELIAEERNLRPNISKDKGKLLAENTPAKRLEITMRLEWRIKRLNEVRERMGNEFV